MGARLGCTEWRGLLSAGAGPSGGSRPLRRRRRGAGGRSWWRRSARSPGPGEPGAGRGSYADQGFQVGEAAGADAADVLELLHGAETAVFGAVVDDAPGQDGPHSGEVVELFEGRGVQVQRGAGGRRRAGTLEQQIGRAHV